MAIYVDDTFNYPGNGAWCHMWTDGPNEELDVFAQSIGLRKSWAHVGGAMRLYHYDLRPSKRKAAIRAGAIYMPMREWVRKQQNS